MLKRTSLAIFLLLMTSAASAEVTLLSPSEIAISPNGKVDIGSVQPGDTLLLSFSKKTDYGNEVKWKEISEELSVLPANWKFSEFQDNELTLTAIIEVAKSAPPNPYNLKIAFESNSAAVPAESVNLRVLVSENLLQTSIVNLKQETSVDQVAVFTLKVDNTGSIASHRVLVNSSLSSSWFNPIVVEVSPNEIKEMDLSVKPQHYGTVPFKFTLNSLNNGSIIAVYDSELNVKPTLVGKYTAALSGFPIFSISLVPYYMINGIISIVFRP